MNGIAFRTLAVASALAALTPSAHAFLFFVPLPNLSKPPQLEKIIDAMEKAQETRALAYVSEDKTFGSKQWTWGFHGGKMTQDEADKVALARCEKSLAGAKAQSAGGQPLYDFGSKHCELHKFKTEVVTLPEAPSPVAQPGSAVAAESSRLPARAAVAEQALVVAPNPASSEPSPLQTSAAPASSPSAGVIPAGQQTKGTVEESPTAKRLRDLKDLFEKKLISEEEYREKRKAVLESI